MNYPDHRQKSVGGIIILIRFQIFPHHICVVAADVAGFIFVLSIHEIFIGIFPYKLDIKKETNKMYM